MNNERTANVIQVWRLSDLTLLAFISRAVRQNKYFCMYISYGVEVGFGTWRQ